MQKWIIGNWKMNPASSSTIPAYVDTLREHLSAVPTSINVGIAPIYLHLPLMQQLFSLGELPAFVLAQNCAQAAETGPHTGEISASQLKDLGIKWVIIGHSERRANQLESNLCIAQKVANLIALQMGAVICVGETLAEREAGQAEQVVQSQLEAIFSLVPANKWLDQIIVAYEPVWAIGTGVAASTLDAQSMHATIRKFLSKAGVAQSIALLYGGSVKPENASELMNQPDIDGFLVGGASLDPISFAQIVKQCLPQPI